MLGVKVVDATGVSVKRSVCGIALAAAVCAGFIFFVPEASLSYEGRAALGIMGALIVLVITAALPLIVVAILVMLLTFSLGVLTYDETWEAFGNYIIFLVIAMFGLCAALVKTTIPQRIIGLLVRWSGSDSKRLVFGFALATTITSAFMSNITACLIYMGLALTLLAANGSDRPGESELGRALFICIPACSCVGGVSTLSGNSYNVLAASLIQQQIGVDISYLQWMVVGFPVALALSLVVAWWLCVVFKPEKISAEVADRLRDDVSRLGPLASQEIKVLVIFGTMIVFWVASTWISWLNTNIVACVGLVVMFLPGVRVINEKEFLQSVPLDIIMFLGCSMAFMSGFMETDATSWIMDFVFANADSWPYLLVLSMVALVPIIAHVLIQAGVVIIMLCMPPLIALAMSCGIDPVVVAFVAALGGGVQFLLPIDGIYLMTFGYRYYSAKDLLKFGFVPTLAMFAVCVAAVPTLVRFAMLL